MNGGTIVGSMSVFIAVGCVVGFAGLLWLLVRRGKRRRKERMARLMKFEQEFGLRGEVRAVRGAPRYKAIGTVDAVGVVVESEVVRSERGGMRHLSRVRGQGTVDLGKLMTMRRDVSSHDTALAAALPEQTFDDQSFEDTFRTLCESHELAERLLPAELRARMVGQGRNIFAFHSIKVAGREVSITCGWSLAWGLSPELEVLMRDALATVTSMCRSGGGS